MIKSSFFEYNVARSALFTAQANLQITGHNIANASTKGYSRQYGVTLSNNPLRGNGTGMYGTGSSVTTVERHRNQFLDQKYWSQNAVLNNYTTKAPYLESMERLFTTIDADGISNVVLDAFANLESVFSDLATNANDGTYRNNVVGSAESLAQIIKSVGTALTEQQVLVNEEIGLTVERMNALADQIARLNTQIKNAEFRGDTANDLRDQRENLIDELSGYANVQIKETQINPDYDPTDPYSANPIYEFKILIDGNLYVDDSRVNTLKLINRDDMKPPVKKNPNDANGLYDIYFGNTSNEFPIYSDSLGGSLKALIDLRDGNNARGLNLTQGQDAEGEYYGSNNYGDEFYRTTNYKGIPHYLDRLNELVRTFSKALNEGKNYKNESLDGVIGHVNGYDLNGETGNYFFSLYDDNGKLINNLTDLKNAGLTDSNSLYSNLNWNNFVLNKDIVDNPDKIATSSVDGTGESDNKVSLGISNLLDNPNLFASGKLNDFVIGISSELAVSSKQSAAFSDKYMDITMAADNQRIAISGVSLNEESVNMAKFQQMYQAAAKMISIIDEIYNTTINGLI